MKKLYLPALFAAVLFAQPPAAQVEPAPDTVIATIDGKNLTYGELHSYISTLSQAQARTAMSNLENTIRQYAMLTRLSHIGEEQKLDQKQPYVEILRAGRMQVMAQAAISEQYAKTLVLPSEQEQYYKDHKAEQYSKLKVKAIYIAFASNAKSASESGKKYRTEAEARTLATNLVAKIRAGADFVALVKEYSEDDQSKKDDGDWGTVNASDNLPDDFKRAVLTLKIGQVTDPMRRTGGFYIFKADSMIDRPYSEVQNEIYNALKEIKMRQWMDGLQQSIPVKIDPAGINPGGKPNSPPAGQ
ncbi:MAG TPA: peptidylprolyl isomerase [Bryobacteraceae bacterium]|jgi:putative heme iron utilization protein